MNEFINLFWRKRISIVWNFSFQYFVKCWTFFNNYTDACGIMHASCSLLHHVLWCNSTVLYVPMILHFNELYLKLLCCNSSSFLTSIRNRPPSSACASLSSSPSMRRNGWSRSWPSAASTHTTSSSTNLFSPTQRGRVKCVKPAIKFSPSI